LNLHEEDEEGFVWEDEAPDPQVKAKWLAVAKVHTTRGFSPSALYADMRSAWNPVKEVIWRKLEDNLFSVQFGCLADWDKAMNMGPWLFRNNFVLLMEEYDGFQNPRTIVLNKIAVWVRVLQLPDNYLKEPVIRGMCRPVGDVKEVQITLPAGFVGEFARVRVKLDVAKKLSRFVSITKDKKKDWYQLKYEKLPLFCGACGILGHWYKECGTGEHDETKLEWGDFMLADGGRSRCRGWNGGRDTQGGRGWGSGRDPMGGRMPPGRGRGRSNQVVQENLHIAWAPDAQRDDEVMADVINARKRSTVGVDNIESLGDLGKTSVVAGIINQIEPGKGAAIGTLASPEKVQPPKRTCKGDGTNKQNLSAAPGVEAVREQ
jgi:hypothetical protein